MTSLEQRIPSTPDNVGSKQRQLEHGNQHWNGGKGAKSEITCEKFGEMAKFAENFFEDCSLVDEKPITFQHLKKTTVRVGFNGV